MKAKYLIFSMDQGIGGHFISLNVISRAINDDPEVICIGYTKPVVEYANIHFIDLNEVNTITAIFKLKNILENETDLIHCFDEHSYFFGRIVSAFLNIPIVLTKCGGKKPRYYPKVKNLVVFTKEDELIYSSKGVNCTLIPNRVVKLNEPKEVIDVGSDFKVLCIARIGNKYFSKIKQSIELLKFYSDSGISVTLDVIGVIESEDILDKLKELSKGYRCTFLTTSKFTQEASRLIVDYDLVVGTGRGVMETFSYKKLCASANSDLKLPILITNSTFEELFQANFSERAKARISESENEENLLSLINNADYKISIIKDYESIFENYFNVSTAIGSYKMVYHKAVSESWFSLFDFFTNYLYLKYIKSQKL